MQQVSLGTGGVEADVLVVGDTNAGEGSGSPISTGPMTASQTG